MNKEEKTLIDRYIENNFFGKLIGMDFKILTPEEVDYAML